MDSEGKDATSRRRVRFERHASQVIFDPSSSSFVVTWSKCKRPDEERLAARRDPLVWIPSVGAMATLYDRGCIPPSRILPAAMAIGKAWECGDREMLDTEEAKKAAELVMDLVSMCVDPTSQSVSRDLGQAIRHLLDEMAAVRFMNEPLPSFDEQTVMKSLDKCITECFAIDGFRSWPSQSMRRRVLFCLNRKERTPVAYTLVSLLFDVGACPLLSLSDRRMLRIGSIRASGLDEEWSPGTFSAFFRHALRVMRTAKEAGASRLKASMTQQQVSDIVAGSSRS